MLEVNGKRIHIVGLGGKGTGRACARVLSNLGAQITISDEKTPEMLVEEIGKLSGLSVRLQLGPHEAYRDIETADIIVPSPGVPLAIPSLQHARAAGTPVVGEIELAYRLARAPIVAITGTKGKTTTTTLIGLLIGAAKRFVRVGGNIGVPLIELAAVAAPHEFLVAEVSSFQLETVDTFHPKVAVFTNLYPDHLDRYENSMESYLAAKLNLFKRQTPEDFAVVNIDRPESDLVRQATRARIVPVSQQQTLTDGVYIDGDQIVSSISGTPTVIMPVSAIRLRGEHNIANVLEAIAAVSALGLPIAVEDLADFRGVPNRLEEVDKIDDVTFYNDSQATTPIAVQMALRAFKNKPVVLIAGGRAKVSDFTEMGRDIVARAHALIVIGEAAELIADAAHHANADFPIYHAENLPAAVRFGYSLAPSGGVVLLSPACSSFDMFRNMEHRGQVFREAVASLRENG